MGSKPFIRVNSGAISLGEAIKYLRTANKLDEFISVILRQHMIEQELKAHPELAIAPETIDQVISEFRQQSDLINPDYFQAWLNSEGIDEALLRQRAELDIQLGQLKALVAEPKLQEYFIERKLQLDQVVLSRIAVEQADLAEELRAQLDEGAPFEELAREYSRSDERFFNGMMGLLSRGDLPDTLRAAIDIAVPGDVIGPLPLEEAWMIFRVEKLLPASLDNPQVLETLVDELFDQWVLQQLQSSEIEVNVES